MLPTIFAAPLPFRSLTCESTTLRCYSERGFTCSRLLLLTISKLWLRAKKKFFFFRGHIFPLAHPSSLESHIRGGMCDNSTLNSQDQSAAGHTPCVLCSSASSLHVFCSDSTHPKVVLCRCAWAITTVSYRQPQPALSASPFVSLRFVRSPESVCDKLSSPSRKCSQSCRIRSLARASLLPIQPPANQPASHRSNQPVSRTMALNASTQALAKLEPYLLLAKSAHGAAAAKLITEVTAAPGCFVFAELLECDGIREVSAFAPSASRDVRF